MSGRTFAIGDIHGDLDALRRVIERMPPVRSSDTIVFLGDYLDRGPHSLEVIRVVRALARDLGCKVVCLRGNHEDAWLRVCERGWDEFVFPPGNGCLATYRSFTDGVHPGEDEMPKREEVEALFSGKFFPADTLEWMRSLPYWYEDEHAIYVHAGLVENKTGAGAESEYLHPRDTDPPTALLWTRSDAFLTGYRGKTVVIGHTATEFMPAELSTHTPTDPKDMWVGPAIIAIDTGAGKGDGFLTAVELPSRTVYESR